MEKLSRLISQRKVDTPSDKLQELKVEAFNLEGGFSQPQSNETINFTNLEFSKLLQLFEKNEKLRKDYFKFGLYNMLSGENVEVFFTKFGCPYSNIEDVLEFILESNNEVSLSKIFDKLINQGLYDIFISKNIHLFNEKAVLTIIKKLLQIILEKKNNSNLKRILSLIIKNIPVDKNYIISLIKNNKHLRLSSEEAIDLLSIVSADFDENKNSINETILNNFKVYFSILFDMLLMFYSQNKISQERYVSIQEEVEKYTKEAKEIYSKIKTSSNYNTSKNESERILKYANNFSQNDFLIEKIKI